MHERNKRNWIILSTLCIVMLAFLMGLYDMVCLKIEFVFHLSSASSSLCIQFVQQ